VRADGTLLELGGGRLVACEANSFPPSCFLNSVVSYCCTFSIFSCYVQYAFLYLKDSHDKFERYLGRLTFCLLLTSSLPCVHDLFSSGVAQSDKKASLSALPLDMEDAITRFVCVGVFL
jgi:hypothetical protein